MLFVEQILSKIMYISWLLFLYAYFLLDQLNLSHSTGTVLINFISDFTVLYPMTLLPTYQCIYRELICTTFLKCFFFPSGFKNSIHTCTFPHTSMVTLIRHFLGVLFSCILPLLQTLKVDVLQDSVLGPLLFAFHIDPGSSFKNYLCSCENQIYVSYLDVSSLNITC